MGDGESSGKPPGMPRSAPADLKDFVACKGLVVEIDTAKLDWVPTQGTGLGDLRVDPGSSPNTGTISLDSPFGSIEMSGSVTADGELALDTSGIPELLGPIRDRIDGWVKAFNDTMRRNEKRLDGFSIHRGKVSLTKSPVAAVADDAATEPDKTPLVAVPPVVSADEPADPKPSGDDSEAGWGCLTWVLGAGALIVIGIGAYFGLAGGDDDQVDTDSAVQEDASQSDSEQVDPNEDVSIGATPQPVPTAQPGATPQPVPTAQPGATPQPVPTAQPETDPEVVLIRFDRFSGDTGAFEFPHNSDVWNVADAQLLGETDLGADVTTEVMIRRDTGTPNSPVIGYLEGVQAGATEIYGFGENGQNGFTVFLDGPEFPTFGASGPSSIAPCQGGYLFTGWIDDSSGSSGSTFYFSVDDPSFPAGSTGSSGVPFEELQPAEWVYDPDTGTINPSSPLSSSFQDCLDSPANASMINTFLSPAGSATAAEQNGWAGPDGPTGSLFGPAGPPADFLVKDKIWFFSTAPAGDTYECESGAPTTSAPAADIIGLGAVHDGSTVTAYVVLNQPLSASDGDQSRAIRLRAANSNGPLTTLIAEDHDGVRRWGEVAPDGTVLPADITVDGSLLRFEFDVGPEPPALLLVEGFNTPTPDSTKGCDTVVGLADPFPAPTSPGRFETNLAGPGGPFIIVDSASEGDLYRNEIGEVLVRVVNACDFTQSYWVSAIPNGEVDFTLTVTDTETGHTQDFGEQATPLAPLLDTTAFATCP